MNIVQKLIELMESQAELQINHNYEIHRELEWRQKVYNFETKNTYTVKDLIILNALINPYEHGDTLDTYINEVITNILQEAVTKENDSKEVKDEDEEKREKAIKEVIGENANVDKKTLFDFPISSELIEEPHDPAQSAKVRECAHLLLRNDWKKQVK